MNKLVPRPDQEEAIRRQVAEPTNAALNASTMGAGKTLMAVETAIRRKFTRILVIGPVGTMSGWRGAFERQESGLPFYWIGGKYAKENLQRFRNGELGVFFIGTELFSRWGWIKHVKLGGDLLPALEQPKDRNGVPRLTPLRYRDGSDVLDTLGRPVLVPDYRTVTKRAPSGIWTRTTTDMVINDEAHRGQNRDGLYYQTLKQLRTTYKLSLSGTPYGNSFSGAWAPCRWLWPDRIDRSFWRWAGTWAHVESDVFAGRVVGDEREPGAFYNSLPCYVRIDPPVEEPDYRPVYVELSAQQRKQYDKLERDLFVEVDGNPLVIDVPATVRIRLREATLAPFSVTEESEVYFAEDAVGSKFKALQKIMLEEEPGNSLFILTDSAKYARILVPQIHKMGFEAAEWSGRVSADTREVIRKGFRDGLFPYLVATIPSIREGIDELARNCGVIVNLSHSDNGVWDRQAISRILGRYKGRVRHYDIMALNTYDTGQISELSRQKLVANATLREKKT